VFRSLMSSWRTWSSNLRETLGTGHIEPRSTPDARPVRLAFGIHSASKRSEGTLPSEAVAMRDAQHGWMSAALSDASNEGIEQSV
jgi:hypothetical protein